MQFCKKCYTEMIGVSSFSKDKYERFYQCRKCNSETKHRKLNEKELDFGEELDKAIRNRK